MIDLTKYYGRKLAYVTTRVTLTKIETKHKIVEVYNPLAIPRKMIAPINNCDIVIDGCSTYSKNIYDIGGIDSSHSAFGFLRFNVINLGNYCEIEQIAKVSAEQRSVITTVLNEVIQLTEMRIANIKQLLENV